MSEKQSNTLMEIIVRPAQEPDIEKISLYIQAYNLDNEDLDYKKFLIAEISGEYAGFGRIKQYGDDIYEIASVGVIEKFRGKGVGKKIVAELINNTLAEEIWITTIIPEYFKQFGFEEDDNFPDEILSKCCRVCEKLNKTTQKSCFMCYRKRD